MCRTANIRFKLFFRRENLMKKKKDFTSNVIYAGLLHPCGVVHLLKPTDPACSEYTSLIQDRAFANVCRC